MSETTTIKPTKYRFGPLERRGVFGSLRPAQLLLLAIGAFIALLLTRSGHVIGAAGAAVVLAGTTALAFKKVGRRGLDEQAPAEARFAARRLLGRTSWRSPAPTAGIPNAEEVVLPPELEDVEVLAAPFRGREVGVIKSTLDNTWTAILSVQVHGFGLRELVEQERAGAQWGTAIASLAAEDSPISRISWVERTVPSDGDEMARYLAEARDTSVPISAPQMQSYLELLDDPGIVAKEHELFVALQISGSKARARIKEEGGGDEGACRVVLSEIATWADALVAAQLRVRGIMTPRMVCRVLRTHYDPFARAALSQAQVMSGEADGGAGPGQAGVNATDEERGAYWADGAVHTTFWIAQWPRTDVQMQFLSPLLLSGDAVRTTAVVMEVLSPDSAEAKVEQARTSDVADARRKSRGGYLVTASARRRYQATEAREEELSLGHALVRFAGYVTVSSESEQGHRRACSQVQSLGRRAKLDLQRMWAEQPAGLTFTLPLCRGLR